MSDYEKKYQLTESELNKLCEDASVSNAIKGLADILSGRSQDLPHRFRAPAEFAQYMQDFGINQTCQYQMYGPNPISLIFTTRPTQGILEIVFQACTGMRLFTLEIEYALQENRKESLCQKRKNLHLQTSRRNPLRKAEKAKATYQGLKRSPGHNWHRNSPKHGDAQNRATRNQSTWKYSESTAPENRCSCAR